MARNVIVAVCFVTSWGIRLAEKKCVQVAVAEVGAEAVVVGKHLMTFWPGAPYCSEKKKMSFNLVRCILILSAAIYSHSSVIRSCVANMNAIINANISASCVFGTAQKVTRSSESYPAIYWIFVLANPQTDQLMASDSLGTIFNFPTRICCGVLHPVDEVLHSVCEVCVLFGCMFRPYLL